MVIGFDILWHILLFLCVTGQMFTKCLGKLVTQKSIMFKWFCFCTVVLSKFVLLSFSLNLVNYVMCSRRCPYFFLRMSWEILNDKNSKMNIQGWSFPFLSQPHYLSINLKQQVVMVSYRDRSLWIWTVWWWLRSLSAAGRWSDLPSRWSNPPHSWESKPSGSTRLPLQQETGNRKSERATEVCVGFT